MKETPLSNCEREFVLLALREKKRLDGRQTYDYRKVKIAFGTEYGCCVVELGKTRVLAQVSCELVSPKPGRPSEGVLFFNLELSPMASPGFEPGRQSEMAIEMNRLLERCLRSSRCVDTESLCVISGEKVWHVRTDIHALNHDGNIMDAAVIAANAALAHFRRPDVTVQGEEVTLYSVKDRDPVPLTIHHMPLTTTFSFFHEGSRLLVDPTRLEERVMEGRLLVAMNKHRELCALQASGGIRLLQDQVLRCSQVSSVKVLELTEIIQRALQNDVQARKEGRCCGFAESLPVQRVTVACAHEATVNNEEALRRANEVVKFAEEPADVEQPVCHRGPHTAQVGDGLVNSWLVVDDEPKSEEEALDGGDLEGVKVENEEVEELSDDSVIILETHNRVPRVVQLSDGSEEDEVMILSGKDLMNVSNKGCTKKANNSDDVMEVMVTKTKKPRKRNK
uniref:exosome complex component RRP45 n=1 Tax=Myxine glutinosa TaxID=7769 RepID=UPI00358F1B66